VREQLHRGPAYDARPCPQAVSSVGLELSSWRRDIPSDFAEPFLCSSSIFLYRLLMPR
jgi:hypothetical protein